MSLKGRCPFQTVVLDVNIYETFQWHIVVRDKCPSKTRLSAFFMFSVALNCLPSFGHWWYYLWSYICCCKSIIFFQDNIFVQSIAMQLWSSPEENGFCLFCQAFLFILDRDGWNVWRKRLTLQEVLFKGCLPYYCTFCVVLY